ncbi:hypothetical protein FRC14_003741 [Serendipita sp. 396]|nr:hypothetical protein FRC14_003741 [Serendipita sp. 396]KAG8873967.1 hypothetical protein FRC20_007076 [Serendipita sp. 405]
MSCNTPSNSTASSCSSSSSGGRSSMDFATTALWAVIVATIFTTIILSGLLFALKVRLRRRTRERVRSFLWELVRGVEDGTVEETVLRRLVYGQNFQFVQHQQEPKLYEVSLSPSSSQLSHASKRDTSPSKESDAPVTLPDIATLPSDSAQKWSDFSLLSLSEPMPVRSSVKEQGEKRKSIAASRRSRTSFQSAAPVHDPPPAATSRRHPTDESSGGSSHTSNTPPEGNRTEGGPTGAVGPCLHFKRKVNAAVIIMMPFQSQARHRFSRLSTSTIPPLRTLSDFPISLASAAPVFVEDATHPVPVPKRDSVDTWDIPAAAAVTTHSLDPLRSTQRDSRRPPF